MRRICIPVMLLALVVSVSACTLREPTAFIDAMPNPATTTVTLRVSGDIDGASLVISNATGGHIIAFDLARAEVTWDLRGRDGNQVASGLYYLAVMRGNQRISAVYRLVVER